MVQKRNEALVQKAALEKLAEERLVSVMAHMKDLEETDELNEPDSEDDIDELKDPDSDDDTDDDNNVDLGVSIDFSKVDPDKIVTINTGSIDHDS